MRSKIGLFAGALSALALAGALSTSVPAQAACWASDPVNSTTAQDAVRAMERAGYTQVHVYAKGCDNAWHAHAMLNGNPVNVVWNSLGQVVTEGD